jgi:hypothetical protein
MTTAFIATRELSQVTLSGNPLLGSLMAGKVFHHRGLIGHLTEQQSGFQSRALDERVIIVVVSPGSGLGV